jgi:hypothetical protein
MLDLLSDPHSIKATNDNDEMDLMKELMSGGGGLGGLLSSL